MNLTFEDVRSLVGGELVDADDSKVGKIEGICLDSDTQEAAWALVHTGLLGRKQNYVPFRGASVSDGSLRVAYSESERVRLDKRVTSDEEVISDQGRKEQIDLEQG